MVQEKMNGKECNCLLAVQEAACLQGAAVWMDQEASSSSLIFQFLCGSALFPLIALPIPYNQPLLIFACLNLSLETKDSEPRKDSQATWHK